jgi:hypothetical protein
MKATRYVDIFMDSAKRSTRFPPSCRSSTIRVFEMAVSAGSIARVTAKTALNCGSSQQGNARRASVASNWVAARLCELPWSSL